MATVVRAKPPLFLDIVAAFPRAAFAGVVFSWGSKTIYYPSPLGPLPASILAHEAVHGARQDKMGIEAWWLRYIADPPFRLAEEIPAHAAEYLSVCGGGASRNQRRQALQQIAKRLSSKLYGALVTIDQAKELIAAD